MAGLYIVGEKVVEGNGRRIVMAAVRQLANVFDATVRYGPRHISLRMECFGHEEVLFGLEAAVEGEGSRLVVAAGEQLSGSSAFRGLLGKLEYKINVRPHTESRHNGDSYAATA